MRKCRKLWERFGTWILLGLCFVCTIAALGWPGQSAQEQPGTAAVSVAIAPNRFVGEELFLRPFLPDEAVWNAALGVWQVHRGLDIACEQVVSPVDGQIARMWQDALWGGCVEIAAGEERIVCRGLANVAVRAGEKVSRGGEIGLAGFCAVEADLGAHVHMEYWRGGVQQDPAELFAGE